MKLYGFTGSPNVFRVALALEEKGLEYEMDHNIGSEQFMQKSRWGLMPMLEDGETVVSESLAILEYLEEKYPKVPLLPSDAAERAKVRGWMYHVLFDVVTPRLRALQGDAGARSTFVMALRDVDNELEGKSFLVGSALSLADVMLAGAYVAFDFAMGQLNLDASMFPNVLKHRELMTKRKAFASIDPTEFFVQFAKNLSIPAEYEKFVQMQEERKKLWRSVWKLT